MHRKFVCLLFIAFLFVQDTRANEKPPLGIEEKIGQVLPDHLLFFNHNSEQVDLKSLIRKPTILVLAYYKCPGICSPLLDGLTAAINESKLKLGEDFQVLTISFNAAEPPELAHVKRLNYIKSLKNGLDKEAWMFFTGDSANIAKITQAAGFHYQKSGNDFVHAAVLTFLNSDGEIVRYLYGVNVTPFDFRMALAEASKKDDHKNFSGVLGFLFKYSEPNKEFTLRLSAAALVIVLIILLAAVPVLYFQKRKRLIPGDINLNQ